MVHPEDIAGEFLKEWLQNDPEYIDLGEFAYENYGDTVTDDDVLMNQANELVKLGMDSIRKHFNDEIYGED